MNVKFFVAALNPLNQVVAEDNNVSIDINVVNPCANDEISIMNPVSSFTYYIDLTGQLVFRDPAVVQTFPQCLRSCSLSIVDMDGTSAVNPNLSSLDSYTGAMAFGTSNKALHNHVYSASLTCTSIQNQRKATTSFQISLQDACLTTNFVWPTLGEI